MQQLSSGGDVCTLQSIHLSFISAESNRIIEAGGWVDGNRVNGNHGEFTPHPMCLLILCIFR